MNRHGLFPDFSVARQSRIYGFAPSSRLELRKNSTSISANLFGGLHYGHG